MKFGHNISIGNFECADSRFVVLSPFFEEPFRPMQFGLISNNLFNKRRKSSRSDCEGQCEACVH